MIRILFGPEVDWELEERKQAELEEYEREYRRSPPELLLEAGVISEAQFQQHERGVPDLTDDESENEFSSAATQTTTTTTTVTKEEEQLFGVTGSQQQHQQQLRGKGEKEKSEKSASETPVALYP